MFQIVLPSIVDGDVSFGFPLTDLRTERLSVFQILRRHGVLAVEKVGEAPLKDNRPSDTACTWSEVNNLVSLGNDLRVVFHHHDRIAPIAHLLECPEESPAVPRMKTDAGFIQNVKGLCQGTPEGTSQRDPLKLAAAQRPGLSVQGEISQANIGHKSKAVSDFPH